MALATTFKINLIYKTPQGVDDTTADQIEDETGLISISQLMLNDLGGEAKEFYGIMQSEGAGEDPRLGSQTCLSAQGAALSVNANGEIEYDPDGSAAIQALAADEWIEDSFVYVIRMADGTLSTARVTFIIHGVNDTPVVEAVAGDTAYWELQETDAGLSKSGTLTVTDRDATDVVNVSVSQVDVVAGDANGLTSAQLSSFFSLASTSLAADTGSANNLGWTFDSGSEAFDHLAAGETLELKYTIQAQDDSGQADGTGLGTVTIKIAGTNDAPVITETSGASAATPILVAENTADSFLFVTATDVDSDSLTYSIGANPDGSYDNQFFTIDAATGALRFTAPPDFEFTDLGDDDLYKVQVTVSDGQGGSAVRDYFVQVTDVAERTAMTVGFEDLSNIASIPDGYRGFNWDVPNAMNLYSIYGDSRAGSGYDHGTIGGYSAFTPFGNEPVQIRQSDGDNFEFQKVLLTAAWDEWQDVRFTGYDDAGNVVGSITVRTTNDAPTAVGAAWGEIDRLEIDLVARSGAAAGPHMVFDNFEFLV